MSLSGDFVPEQDTPPEPAPAEGREESYALFDVMLDSMPGLFFLIDESGRFLRWNKNVETVSGYSAAEIAAMDPLDFTEGDEKQLAERKMQEIFDKGYGTAEFHFVAKDGTRTLYYYTGRLVHLSGRRCIIGTAVDLSERRQLEEQYRRAQKMEAVGRLAGGVAHDFNNLVTIINGYCSILMATLPPHAKTREIVEHISKAGERAAGLTQQLLAYGRKQTLQPQLFDLNQFLNESAPMLRGTIGAGAELTIKCAASPCMVKADPHQIEQVLMNLAINARDAMPKGGTLTIATERVDIDNSEFAEVRAGPYVQMSVCDSGSGMDPATLTRIFEPFFTTKTLGQGAGLGLATVFGIVKQSGGHIRVFSELGQGSRFHVCLPLWLEEAEPALDTHGEPNLPCGTETVLLVEDEPAVRYLGNFVLKRSGYTVLQAANGVEALEVCARHPDTIHILATDLTMPRMGGRQLAESLRRLYPDLRVLFMSGYTEDELFHQGVRDANCDFLQKPFSLSDLTKKIRDLLDRK